MKKIGCFRFILLVIITVFLLLYIPGEGRNTILKYMYPIKYENIVEKYSREYNLDKYLIYSVIKTESKFNEKAVSNANAKGLMQLMDETALYVNEKASFGYNLPDDIYNPEVNISLGCWYLKNLLEKYNNDITLAITAYNGGEGNVEKWLEDNKLSDGDGGLLDIPFKETKGYVDKVLNAYERYIEIYD